MITAAMDRQWAAEVGWLFWAVKNLWGIYRRLRDLVFHNSFGKGGVIIMDGGTGDALDGTAG